MTFVGAETKRYCTDIYSMRIDGAALQRLTSSRACEFDPVFSPDGLSIAFQAETGYASHIVVASATGRRPTVVGDGWSPDWAPDGKTLAYASGSEIRIVDKTGRPIRTLELGTPDRFRISGVAWAPTGDQLVFAQLQASGSGGVRRGADRIYAVTADGSMLRELTVTGIDDDHQPTWQSVTRR